MKRLLQHLAALFLLDTPSRPVHYLSSDKNAINAITLQYLFNFPVDRLTQTVKTRPFIKIGRPN